VETISISEKLLYLAYKLSAYVTLNLLDDAAYLAMMFS